jgi:hypothetical protein
MAVEVAYIDLLSWVWAPTNTLAYERDIFGFVGRSGSDFRFEGIEGGSRLAFFCFSLTLSYISL